MLHAEFTDRIVVARNGSPLIVGVGEGEVHVASDLAALVRYTDRVAAPRGRNAATLTTDGFVTYRDGVRGSVGVTEASGVDAAAYETGEHASFMLKEILEQPEATERALRGRLDSKHATAHLGGLNLSARDVRGSGG